MDLLTLLENEPVEWKKLGDVVEVAKGQQLNKTELTDVGEFPAYNGGKTYSGWTNQYNVEENTIIISQGGESAGYVNFVTSKFWANAHCYYIKKNDKVNNRYIYHVLKMNQESFMQSQHGSGIPALKLDKINKFEIPIPSLEVQEKIAKTLDKFTEYVTELQTELQKRIDQYTYYRDTLLSEEYIQKLCKEMEADRRVTTVRLEEVVSIKNGKDWKNLGEGTIPVYGSGGEMGLYVDTYAYDKPTVLIPRKGSIDNVFYLETPFWNVDTVFYTEIDVDRLLPKYFYYFVEHYDLSRLSENPTRPSLTQSQLNKLLMPLPPLSLQHKIVTILDKFQAMIVDAKGLLPTEIEQRQQQYEYYREKLLTFSSECDSTHAR